MKIFFDTEFEGLFSDAKLISIGLITESGDSNFYAELTDTYSLSQCSEFCKSTVLPLLQGDVYAMSLADLRVRLSTWLAAHGPDLVLVCDSPRDAEQIRSVFPDGLPANCTCKPLGILGNLRRRVFNRGRRIHTKLGLRVHHALDDARVNRLVLTGKCH
jgi:hypothetical protein